MLPPKLGVIVMAVEVLQGYCCKCGDCCREITLPFSPEYIKEVSERERPVFPDSDAVFIADNWECVGYDKGSYIYHCKHFNEETNLCSIYEHRPAICRGYPWYGEFSIDKLKHLPRRCTYRVGR